MSDQVEPVEPVEKVGQAVVVSNGSKTFYDLMAHQESLRPTIRIEGKPLEGKRIFMLEDDMDAMTIVAHLLRTAGATVMTERQGYMTIAIIQRMLPLDLAILDLNLPGTHGFTAFASIKALPKFKDMKMVCCTALRDKIGEAKALGFDGFISKPIQPQEFVKNIIAVLDGKPVWVRT